MTTTRFFLCGDVMLGRGIDQILQHPSRPRLYETFATSALDYVRLAEAANGPIPRHVAPDYVWGDALQVLHAVKPDARIINLETAITTSDQHWPKGINYRMNPNNIACLTAARIDCCGLANNHVLDWGRAGLLDTLAALHGAGIRTAGAGANADEAAAPAVLRLAGGGRVLVFGYAATTSGVPPEWAAGTSSPGVNLLPDVTAATATRLSVLAQKQGQPGDLLIASVHWGGNWGYTIPALQQAFARGLIDGGFDVVHGHSSHHPKGLEIYRQKLILYGCGDFINDYEGISNHAGLRSDLGIMYLPKLDTATGCLLALDMMPMQTRRFRLNRPSREDARWLYEVIAHECRKLKTDIHLRTDNSFAIDEAG
ncbi:MAG: poly-gamma-glutamate biosynthesis protein [Rhodospirillales bacterium 20-64-7]|nr:MAG: poly-gamma-glutamate biosynthesis protein [Rhodospirillales bacterium 20-64-7]HQT76595.1 CapA family protein [Rhodopila sp.]